MEIIISKNTAIFPIEVVDQVWFFIIFLSLKQYIAKGCEPIILVLNVGFGSFQASFQISFVHCGRKMKEEKVVKMGPSQYCFIYHCSNLVALMSLKM
jgi:hypothetical protein